MPRCLRACHGRHGGRPLRAFTLVEVLIVIVVISLLIAVIGLVGVKVLHGQKAALTEMTMRNVKIAIDRFAELDPLKNIYGRKENAGPDGLWGTGDDVKPTFGPYPPYTLASSGVAGVVEPNPPLNLAARLTSDLSGIVGVDTRYVDVHEGNRNDDIRALYTYLAVYVPDTLGQIPQAAKKALPDRPPGDPSEKVNPAGTGTNPPGEGAIDVLGIYDAWVVPLDYFLYVKLEWDGIDNRWRVTQRIPVLRSHGVSAEEFAAGADTADTWIFSDPFPSPKAAGVAWDSGLVTTPGIPSLAGWARAIGAGDLVIGSDQGHSFGYVP